MVDEWERRLRALRLQRRESQEDLEAATAELEAASATLASVLREAGERGDRCVVEVGPHRLTGLVTHVGDDVLRVAGEAGTRWDIALDVVAFVAIVTPGRVVHTVSSGHPVTMLARARELAGRDATVDVGRTDRPDAVRGRLRAVSSTHLVLDRAGAGRALVAWSAVAWLAES